MCRLLALLFCLIITMHRASAVVVAQSNDPLYTQPPASDDFGFASVGIVFNSIAGIPSSGVYLGDGWVLSAYHNVSNGGSGFTFGFVTFGGIGYTVDPATATRLHNPDNSLADLAMFRLTSEPPVLSASLSGTTPVQDTPVSMLGNGQDRSDTLRRWLVINNTWTEVQAGGNRSGYDLVGTRALRWGTNTVQPPTAEPDGLQGVGSTFGTVRAFRLDWDNVPGEGMATFGDSGGGVFRKNGSEWELAGIVTATAGFTNQPAGTVVYENITYAADIATYKSEIEFTIATVPEPSTALLLLSGVAMLSRRRGRSK